MNIFFAGGLCPYCAGGSASVKVMTPKLFAIAISGCLLVVTLVGGCAAPPPPNAATLIYADRLPQADRQLQINQLSSCTAPATTTLNLNHNEPITVIVHGCFSSAGRFRALADVFAFHGQQAICFNYNDRDSLKTSGLQLRQALFQLAQQLPLAPISVIAHSQGGLVARYALTDADPLQSLPLSSPIQLATVSSPFSGIDAATHCGWPWLAVASLGLTIPICQIATGDKWYEIPPGSAFITHPGRLTASVARHLTILTDERNSCRRVGEDGQCAQSDFVFSLAEQYQPRLGDEHRTSVIEIAAGHVEIVGDHQHAPEKLIALLQQQGLMRATAADERDDLQKLLALLYLQRPTG